MPPRKRAETPSTIVEEQREIEAAQATIAVAEFDPRLPAIATVQVYGPDGDLCPVGRPIPSEWPHDFIASLVATGGATQGE